MGAALHDLAVIHHQDQVTVTDGGQAVRHDQHGTICKLVVDHVEDQVFGREVQIAGGLIQNVEVGVLQESACQRDALLLAAGKAVACFLQIGIVLQGQVTDEVVGVRFLGGLLHFVQRCVHAGNTDVVVDGLAEQLNVLRHIGDSAAHRSVGILGQVHAVDVDLAILRLVVLEQKLGDGGLAAAAAAHQRDLLAGRDGEADVIQRRGAVAVAEGDVLELNVALDLRQVGAVFIASLLGGVIHDLGQTLHGDAGLLDLHLQTDQVAQRGSEVRGKGAEGHEAAQRHLAVQHLADAHIGGQHAETGGDKGGDQALGAADLAGPQADLQALDVLTLEVVHFGVLVGVALDGLDAAQALDHLTVQRSGLHHGLLVDLLVGLLVDQHQQDADQRHEQGDGEQGGVHAEQDDAGDDGHRDIHDQAQRDAGEDGFDGVRIRITGGDITGLAGSEELHGQLEDVPEVAQHQRDVDLDGQIDQHPLPDEAHQRVRDAHQTEHDDQCHQQVA